MVLETRMIRRLALVASAGWLALALPGPARADDNWWNSMLGMIGMGGPNKPADDAIDYSARPALVVPPKMDLPPPQAALPRPADWPHDPDTAARRRAEADSRQPAPQAPAAAPAADDSSADDTDQSKQAEPAPAPDKTKASVAPTGDFSKSAGLAGGGSSIFSGNGGAIDLSNFNLSNWNPFGSHDDTKAARTLKVGVEPQREYLTQPPPGYRAPVAVDDSTQNASDPTDAAAPAPDQTKKVSADK